MYHICSKEAERAKLPACRKTGLCNLHVSYLRISSKKNGGGAVWTAAIIRARLLWSLTVTDYAKRITLCVWVLLFFANYGDKTDGKRAES